MTMTAVETATPRQVSFIEALMKQREGAADVIGHLEIADLTKNGASALIDKLVALPKKTAQPSSSVELKDVPVSRYALPTAELGTLGLSQVLNGNLLFVEVREYRGTRYMRKLIGAPGAFSRMKMPATDTSALAAVLAENPYRFAKLFGQHYTCCGKCGAELTDQRSRELFLGPVCRKAFGYDK